MVPKPLMRKNTRTQLHRPDWRHFGPMWSHLELSPRAPVRPSLKERRRTTVPWAHYLQDSSKGAGAMWFEWQSKAGASAAQTPIMELVAVAIYRNMFVFSRNTINGFFF